MIAVAGNVLIFVFAAILVMVAKRRYERYGREALDCAALFIFTIGVNRALSIAHVISTDRVREINSYAILVCTVILAEAVWLHRVEVVTTNGGRSPKEAP